MRFGFAPFHGSEKAAAQYVGTIIPTTNPLDFSSSSSWKTTLIILSSVGLIVLIIIVLAVVLTNKKKKKEKKKKKKKKKREEHLDKQMGIIDNNAFEFLSNLR